MSYEGGHYLISIKGNNVSGIPNIFTNCHERIDKYKFLNLYYILPPCKVH